MKKKKTTNSKLEIVREKLNSLGLGDSFSVDKFVKKHWGDDEFSLYYFRRSFDVFFCKVRKELSHSKRFVRSKGRIIRGL